MTYLKRCREAVVIVGALLSAFCGDGVTSPDGVQTQARVVSNTGWRWIVDGVQHNGTVSVAPHILNLGTGEKCITAWTVAPRTAGNPETITVTIGNTTRTSMVLGERISACGRGPVS